MTFEKTCVEICDRTAVYHGPARLRERITKRLVALRQALVVLDSTFSPSTRMQACFKSKST
jgi:hypothetical protein